MSPLAAMGCVLLVIVWFAAWMAPLAVAIDGQGYPRWVRWAAGVMGTAIFVIGFGGSIASMDAQEAAEHKAFVEACPPTCRYAVKEWRLVGKVAVQQDVVKCDYDCAEGWVRK